MHVSRGLAALTAPLALLMGAGTVAAAPVPSATYTAVDAPDTAWVLGGGGAEAQLILGGAATFSYPAGALEHNARISPKAGVVCTTPVDPAAAGWNGTCTFSTAGIYTFVCDLHANMTGKIRVANAEGTLPADPPAGWGGGPTPPPSGGSGGGGTPDPVGGGAPGGGGGSSEGAAAPPAAAKPVTLGPIARKPGRIEVVVANPGGVTAGGKVVARSATKVGKGKRKRVIALTKPASYTVTPGGKTTVRLTLTKAGKALLARKARVRVVVTPSSGAAVEKVVTLRP
ncbi:MAG: hypothetical protein JHC95_20920 [Solirubrobacteraceae bacterium]|nr:hypothetical protein [Solirubrobacteraceae bacterium]